MKPTSIILPTLRKTDIIDELIDQLSEDDELLIVCDSEDNTVAEADFESDKTKLIIAGEPKGCSGKANAIYEGMKAAENERVVWTDNDFHHPEDWLEKLHQECNEHGAVSELPFFIGKNPLTIINEPTYALVMLITYLNNQVWGGAVMFDRDQFNEEKFLEELQSTIGDDVLLSEHLDAKTLRRTRKVEIDGTIEDAVERITRFVKHIRYHEPVHSTILGIVAVFLAAVCIKYPLYSLITATAGYFAIYQFLGRNRFTFIFAYFSLLLLPLFLIYGLLRRSFVWKGRRYKYKSKLDVKIINN